MLAPVKSILWLLETPWRWLDKGKPADPWRTTKRWVAFFIWALGTVFILWANRFHVTAAAVFLCIGFFAVEHAVINLFRTGARAVGGGVEGDEDTSTWGRPIGARAELEREKKSLLKAIKEAEFDREMDKLSKADADEMIGLYRARAIEVIKEIDKLDGKAGTVREQIEREVKARLELSGKGKAKANAAKRKKNQAEATLDAAAAAEKAATAAETAAAAASIAASPGKEIDGASAADAAADQAASAAVEARAAAADAREAVATVEAETSEKTAEAHP